jgi:hypothetical protein
MEREIVSQLMGQKGAIKMRDQDSVLVGDIEGHRDPVLCLGGRPKHQILVMNVVRRNDEHLWTGLGAIRGDAHEAGNLEIQRVHRVRGDLAVAEVEDVGMEPGLEAWVGEILNATEASLKEEKGEQKQWKNSEVGFRFG